MTAQRIFRLMFLILVSVIFLIAGVCVNLLLVVSARERARVDAVLTMLWSKAMCSVMGIRIDVSGLENAPSGFAVSNHVSYLDVFVLGSMRPVSFLAKSEVRGWPVVGWLSILGGTIFIKRELKKTAIRVMQEMERKIDYGVMVIIFPEGTTSDGKSIRRFKSTFFSLPARRNIPVTPVSIRYPQGMLDKIAWYGGMKLVPHFWNLLGIRRIDAVLRFNEPVLNPDAEGSPVEARKRLCTLAYESVAAGVGLGRQS
jgi:1-acyl-sn-glycerol-3-phosphate acyltransferase